MNVTRTLTCIATVQRDSCFPIQCIYNFMAQRKHHNSKSEYYNLRVDLLLTTSVTIVRIEEHIMDLKRWNFNRCAKCMPFTSQFHILTNIYLTHCHIPYFLKVTRNIYLASFLTQWLHSHTIHFHSSKFCSMSEKTTTENSINELFWWKSKIKNCTMLNHIYHSTVGHVEVS